MSHRCVVMGCDIHVTMERRVWQLDAASLAALSLLRMLFLRAGASEQLSRSHSKSRVQTAVQRVLQTPELVELIARSVSLVCAADRSNLVYFFYSQTARVDDYTPILASRLGGNMGLKSQTKRHQNNTPICFAHFDKCNGIVLACWRSTLPTYGQRSRQKSGFFLP